jgi:hypothetical protein
MRYMDYAKRTVPMHDDIYDFFLQELPGYDDVGFAGRTSCAGAPSTTPTCSATTTRT